MWQEVIVAIMVLAAFYYVIRQWLPKKNAGSCGGCGGCASAKSCSNPDEKGTH
jgi:hypothetical protein